MSFPAPSSGIERHPRGVAAFISFYLPSRYAMTMLIEKYCKRPSAVATFHLDRVARLFPQSLFCIAT
jgi:peptidoglycan/LPS O-acetylase OafA/YrhL